MIVGIHHVALGVSDFEKALKFYTEGLGFEVVQESEFDNSAEVLLKSTSDNSQERVVLDWSSMTRKTVRISRIYENSRVKKR